LFFAGWRAMLRQTHSEGRAMTLRERLAAEMKDAMRARAADRLSTLRLITSAIKDREIAARSEAGAVEVTDTDILQLLGKMMKQRQESARAFEAGGRPELTAKELAEVAVIEEFLPQQMSAAAVDAAITAAIAETGAVGMKDMGRVIAVLKAAYTGQMDFAAVGPAVKVRLG